MSGDPANTQLPVCFETVFLCFLNILLMQGLDALLSICNVDKEFYYYEMLSVSLFPAPHLNSCKINTVVVHYDYVYLFKTSYYVQ